MDSTTSYSHRRSPSSDHFLGLFTFSPPSTTTIAAAGDELNEAEVFWTTDFPESNHNHNHRLTFTRPHNSGILAVLPVPDDPPQVLYRKPSYTSSSKPIPSIPRLLPQSQSSSSSDGDSQTHSSKSAPSRKFQQHSAPMKVPVLAKAMIEKRRSGGDLAEVVVDDDDYGDEEMLPPHELVARGSEMSMRTTFSVLEGMGRTLKGRDLRQVRNAIWRKTGFLD